MVHELDKHSLTYWGKQYQRGISNNIMLQSHDDFWIVAMIIIHYRSFSPFQPIAFCILRPHVSLGTKKIMTLVLKGNISCWFCLLIILWFSVFVNFTSKCEIQIGWGRRSHMDATSNLRARDGSPIFLLWNVCGLYLIEGLTVIIWTLATRLVSNFRLSAVWTKWHHSWRNS